MVQKPRRARRGAKLATAQRPTRKATAARRTAGRGDETLWRDLAAAAREIEHHDARHRKSSKSLHRMLAPHGNPSTENFFGIVRALQKQTRVKLSVTAKAA